jgi:hypothetical protein
VEFGHFLAGHRSQPAAMSIRHHVTSLRIRFSVFGSKEMFVDAPGAECVPENRPGQIA